MSSIIGIDIGDLYTKAATLDNGVIENLLFNQSNRMNHSYITLKDKTKRLIGNESLNIFKNNMENSVHSFNYLIHNIFLDNNQEDIQGFFNKNAEDDCFVPIKTINNQKCYLNYIFLSYLELTLKSLSKDINDDLVLSIPGYFNICDVKFLMDSLNLNKYNYLLLSQEYAISLDYGFYKSFKNEFKNDKNVLFINIGYNSSQIFLTNFDNSGMKIIYNKNINIGGNHFTNRLFDYINALIFKKYNYNLNNYPKKKFMVLKECEKVKKQLSTLKTSNLFIDCLTEEISINENISRELFNNLTQNLILEIVNSLNDFLKDIDLNLVDNIEMLGGGMRVPKIKESISIRLNKNLSYTLNAEESVSKGCVIYGAINSPQIKNANYQIEKFFPEALEMHLTDYNKPVLILEKGFHRLPLERSIMIPFNKNFNIKFMDKSKDFMANYQILTQSKGKIEITIRYNLDNQIEIINYEIKSGEIKSIKQLFQSNLDEEDKKEILDNLNTVNKLENKIDLFYESVNYLENFYYNSIDINYLNLEEIDEFNRIKVFIKNNIVDEEPTLESYDYVEQNMKIIKNLNIKIENRINTYNTITDNISNIEEKISSINIESNKLEKINDFKIWLSSIKKEMEKFNVIELENKINSELEKINHLLYEIPHE